MQVKHGDPAAVSEPAAFVRFAERVPGWGVVMCMIGDGQEIHSGEEGGMSLWAEAVATNVAGWDVVGPERFRPAFAAKGISYTGCDELHLSHSVRFHFAAALSDWVAGLVDDKPDAARLATIARELANQGYQLRVTRSLAAGREFLHKKYAANADARFGLLASSRDKRATDSGVVPRGNRSFRPGPWYADAESSPNSCRRLQDPATEFAAQGLELDHTLLLWGSDFVLKNGDWDITAAKTYKKTSAVVNPRQLRRNAYRVLLTRGREGVVMCLPQFIGELDETYAFLANAGCEILT